jgi:hypothetical protein
MTPAERRMLEFLDKHNGMRAGAIGAGIYGGTAREQGRNAANVLYRLARQGLVTSHGLIGYWSVTTAGYAALRSLADPARCRDWIGRRVRLVREIWTKGGRTYDKGSIWRVESTWRGRYTVTSAFTNRHGWHDRMGFVSRADFEEV